MEQGMRKIVPQVKIATEAAVMFNWSKKADEAYNEKGEYVPWELADKNKQQ
jgi:hypothetical protein